MCIISYVLYVMHCFFYSFQIGGNPHHSMPLPHQRWEFDHFVHQSFSTSIFGGFFFRSPTEGTGESRFLDESFWVFGMKVLVCFFLIHSSIPFASHFRWGQFLSVWFLWKIFLFKFTELENVLVNHSQRIARME